MVAPPEPNGNKFPLRCVIILALALLVNAYTLANLFPYVGMMVKHLMGLSTTNESGYYAGYVASSFTFGRFLSGYFWGHAADTIGRKPVIIIGLSSIGIFSVVFGFATTFGFAVTSRFILGLTNGIIPAVRTVTREVCGPEHVVAGMTYVSGSRGIGIVIATGAGGLLAQPALHYPSMFSPSGLFAKFPFLLPNLVGAGFAVLLLPLVAFYLPETRADVTPHVDQNASSDAAAGVGLEPGVASNIVDTHRQRDRGRFAYQRVEDVVDKHEETPQERGHVVVAAVDRNNCTRIIDDVDEDSPTTERSSMQKHRKEKACYGLVGRAEGADSDGIGMGVVGEARSCSGGCGGDGGRDDVPRPIDRKQHPGLCGSSGLLSLPSVTMLLLIVPVVQVLGIGFEEAYPLWALSTTDVGGLGWGTDEIGQVLGIAGLNLAVLQLGIFPRLIKKVGAVNWQRAGCLLGVATFLAVPNAKILSWNTTSLVAVSVVNNTLINCCIGANMLLLTVASTNVGSHNQRGKLGGLFITVESIGRFTGPVVFSNMFAWSISCNGFSWVDYHFVFYLSAVGMAVVAALGWRSLAVEAPKKPPERGAASNPAAIAGGDSHDSVNAPCIALRSKAEGTESEMGSEQESGALAIG